MTDADRLTGIAFELDYCKQVIAVASDLNDGIDAAATHLMDTTVSLVTLLTAPDDTRAEFVGDGLTASGAGMTALQALQAPLAILVSMAEGRLIALQREVDGL